eukprot:5258797-Pyramimonas_sp.AAC.1
MPQSDRAWRDSRLAMLAYGVRYDEWRQNFGDITHRFNSKRKRAEEGNYRKRKRGIDATGLHAWHYPFEKYW